MYLHTYATYFAPKAFATAEARSPMAPAPRTSTVENIVSLFR